MANPSNISISSIFCRRGHGHTFVRGSSGRSLSLRGQGRGRGRGRGRQINTRYYSPEEWANLSPEQRDQILTVRGTK